MFPRNTWRLFTTLLLIVNAPATMARDGVIHFRGAITVPTCPIILVPTPLYQQPSPGLMAEGEGCEGTGRIGAFSVEMVGAPQDGYAVVTLLVY